MQWPLVAFELVLLLLLIRLNPRKLETESPLVRRMSWILTLAIVLGNTVSAVTLDYLILFREERTKPGCSSGAARLSLSPT